MSKKNVELFKSFLDFYFLRPENALMLTLRSISYKNSLEFFHNKSIDVCCGDGVFSFLTLGGKLNRQVDMYQSIKLSNEIVRKIDNYDDYNKEYSIKILTHPNKKFETGCDYKINLLNKAKHLNFYKNLFYHDINRNFKVKDKYNFVYSNSTYWSNNFQKHVNDLVKITNNGGYIVLQIKNDSIFKNYVQSEKYSKIFGNKFCKIIDAGRKNTWKSLKNYSDILKIIKENKFVDIIDISPVYGNVMPHIWNFGLRPIFQPLYKMTSKMTKKDRFEIKKELVNITFNMFENYIRNFKPNLYLKNRDMEYTYILKKI